MICHRCNAKMFLIEPYPSDLPDTESFAWACSCGAQRRAIVKNEDVQFLFPGRVVNENAY